MPPIGPSPVSLMVVRLAIVLAVAARVAPMVERSPGIPARPLLDNLGDVKRRSARWSHDRRKRLTTPGGSRLPIYGTESGCQTRTNDEAECARQWNAGLRQSARHGLRQLVAYQLIPAFHPTWDTSLLRRDGSPSLAMRGTAAWTRAAR